MSGVRESKIYKNPERKKGGEPNAGHYTPQYKQMGIIPEEIGGKGKFNISPITNAHQNYSEDNNPRTRLPSIRQNYTEKPKESLNGDVPNVGNNMEHSWSGVDEEIIDDLFLESDHQMIDNNELVDIEKIQNHNYMIVEDLESLQKGTKEVEQDLKCADLDSILLADEGSYILIVGDAIIQTGSLEQVQQTAASLVFGEHEMCQGNAVPVDNVVVLKKVNIKVGLFLE